MAGGAVRHVDLLDRLLKHDAWTTEQLLGICSGLTERDLDRRFPIGHKTLRATLTHIIANMEVWSALMAGDAALVERVRSSSDRSLEGLGRRLREAAQRLAAVAHDVRDRGGWDETWTDFLDDPPADKTYGGAVAHVLTHSMHHRAQILFMLRELGVPDLPEGDVLSWERQASDQC